MSIHKRGEIWALKRRVPARCASVEKRPVVWVSLKTDSETTARHKADQVWQGLVGKADHNFRNARSSVEGFQSARCLPSTAHLLHISAKSSRFRVNTKVSSPMLSGVLLCQIACSKASRTNCVVIDVETCQPTVTH